MPDETNKWKPAGGRGEITSLMRDPDFVRAWTDRTHPNHADAMAAMAAAHEQTAKEGSGQ